VNRKRLLYSLGAMDLRQVIGELLEELECVDHVIAALEKLEKLRSQRIPPIEKNQSASHGTPRRKKRTSAREASHAGE
jgi:hypothetical protein